MSGRKTLLFILALALALAGCVSSKEHKAKLADIENLRQNINALNSELEAAKNANDKLKADNQDLTARVTEREQRITRISAELEKSGATIATLSTTVDTLSADKQKILEEKAQAVSKLKTTYDDLVSEMQNEIQEGQIQITQLKDKLSLRMVDKILFDSGSATVKPEGKKVLDRVSEILKTVQDKQIRIEGHTDNVPIGMKLRDKFPTNWELSTIRATNVVRYLTENGGVNPDLMSVAGYSEFRPVAPNDTDEDKAKNRRIEITLLPLETGNVEEE